MASELLLQVVLRAIAWARTTDGVFDPTLLPQIERLGYTRTFSEIERAPLPPLDAAPTPGGAWRAVDIDPGRRIVTLPCGAGFDTGGIAKGMAVDAALEALVREGIETALVNAGGDLAVRGLPEGHDAWPVGLEGLADGVILLERGAVATSGPRRRRWLQGDVERHHLLDATTGYPVQGELATASVIASSCEEADVLATTVFCMGVAAGEKFLAARGRAGLFVTSDGRRLRAGFWPEGTG